MNKETFSKKIKLPASFKPFFWSYDFFSINPEKQPKTVIVNLINYGDLKHWRWLIDCYGKAKIRNILKEIPATEIRDRSRKLAGLLFNIKEEEFNYALRGANKRRQPDFSKIGKI